MNKKLFSVVLIISSLFLIPLVQAGPIFDLFSRVIQTNTISNLYNNYQEFIEFFIYMVIFISLIIGVFKDRFEKKQTKAIAIALGTALSISLVNFMPGLIGKLGPIAFFIFVALFWFLIFASLKKGLESSLLSMALAYIFAFLTFVFLDHDKKVQNFLKRTEVGEFLLGSSTELFILALFIALIALFWWLIKKFGGWTPSSGGAPSGGGTPTRISTPTTTVSTGGGSGGGSPSFWKDRKWWGGKKSSHPSKVSKNLKNALKADELEVNQIEDAIGLLKDLKKAEDRLSEEEKSAVLSKINDYLTRIIQADPTESIENLVNERLQEIDQLRKFLNPTTPRINDIPLSKVVSSLDSNRYISESTKNELKTLIAEMDGKDRKLSNYARTLSTFKRVYDTRGQQFRRLAEQIMVNINTGQTQGLPKDLGNLLALKKHLAETDERISRVLEDPEFVYAIEDVKNIYGPPEGIEDRTQEHINIHNIIRSALGESYVNKFNTYLHGFMESFEGEKTYQNFLRWLASKNIKEVEPFFGIPLEDFENMFNARISGNRSEPQEGQRFPPAEHDTQRIERRDPKELFRKAKEYGNKIGKAWGIEKLRYRDFIFNLTQEMGINSYEDLLRIYQIDDESLKRIFERATGVVPEEFEELGGNRSRVGEAERRKLEESLIELLDALKRNEPNRQSTINLLRAIKNSADSIYGLIDDRNRGDYERFVQLIKKSEKSLMSGTQEWEEAVLRDAEEAESLANKIFASLNLHSREQEEPKDENLEDKQIGLEKRLESLRHYLNEISDKIPASERGNRSYLLKLMRDISPVLSIKSSKNLREAESMIQEAESIIERWIEKYSN
ncbi:hypothetical protein J4442_00900 [Candidatus Woesearchaeota archaeon]|nr:hypothetical protein [Candidatus Woesearchaeota archaeon]